MKKIFIIFLFIIFSSSFSLAKNNEKITVEEIENIFFGKKKILHYPDFNMNVLIIGESNAEKYQFIELQIKNNLESYKKKVQTRGIAKCMYDFYKFMGNIMWGDTARERKCYAKVIYTIYPVENSVLFTYLNKNCFKEIKISSILNSYEIKSCYEING